MKEYISQDSVLFPQDSVLSPPCYLIFIYGAQEDSSDLRNKISIIWWLVGMGMNCINGDYTLQTFTQLLVTIWFISWGSWCCRDKDLTSLLSAGGSSLRPGKWKTGREDIISSFSPFCWCCFLLGGPFCLVLLTKPSTTEVGGGRSCKSILKGMQAIL